MEVAARPPIPALDPIIDMNASQLRIELYMRDGNFLKGEIAGIDISKLRINLGLDRLAHSLALFNLDGKYVVRIITDDR
jgi:hypothetical protein